MKLEIFQVDAFTTKLFAGNPAAIVPLDEWLPTETMLAIAAENNLAETAFFVGGNGKYDLRWFTPSIEMDLCGHATLASAFVLAEVLKTESGEISFETKSGELRVTRDGRMRLARTSFLHVKFHNAAANCIANLPVIA